MKQTLASKLNVALGIGLSLEKSLDTCGGA